MVDSTTTKTLPNGTTIGPDGKPCKTCNSLTNFRKSNKKNLTTVKDCPPDSEALGRATWTFLHTAASYYPTSPSPMHQRHMLSLLNALPSLYPCHVCADHLGEVMKVNPPDKAVTSREKVMTWLCQRHNEVNETLGKEIFSCSITHLDERWKDGPKDGRCG
jgi:FAD-linked sulfhydryl oxidase